ncbi:MAG: peptidoglycan editing factor PgeF [Thermodesulfovibrionales bacterium]
MILTNIKQTKGIALTSPIDELPVLYFFTTKEFTLDMNDYLKNNLSVIPYFPIQRHTDSILVIDKEMPEDPVIADAVLTGRENVFIGVKTADCVPIIIYDTNTKSIGVIHAGWRGTSKLIAIKTIEKMVDYFNVNPIDIKVVIGASIGRCCYEVDEDVFERITNMTPNDEIWHKKGKKYHVDLQKTNVSQILLTGVRRENIVVLGECTACLNVKYHSYRRDGMTAGRQYAVIGMV